MSQELREEAPAAPVRELLETTCDLQRVAMIFNPVSGTTDCTARRSTLEGSARSAGLNCSLAETDADRGAGPLARQAVEDGMERVLVSGGDGSVTEAADALAGTGVTLAVLPGGTGNLLALNLGIPVDCEEAMRLALTGRPQPFDVGRANGQVFLIMVGMGVDAWMVHDADREAKRRLGALAYFLAAWKNLGEHFVLYTITIDGRRIRRVAQTVMVANVGKITGGIELVPGSNPHDGRLEVAILRARNLWAVGAIALRALLGRNRSDELLEIHRGRQIVIQTRRPQPVQVDGNEAPPTNRLEVHVEPGAVQLVCPDPEGAGTAETLAELLTTGNTPAWVPLATGLAGAAILAVQGNRQWRKYRKPGFWRRHPVLGGLAVGAATEALSQLARRRTRPQSRPAPSRCP